MRKVEASRRAVGDRANLGRGVGLGIAEVGRRCLRPGSLLGNQANDVGCGLFFLRAVFPNEVMAQQFKVGGQLAELPEINRPVNLALSLKTPSGR